MDRVIRTDRATLRLTWLWVALSLYMGSALLGFWFAPLGKLTMPCLVLSVLTSVIIVASSIRFKGHNRSRQTEIFVILFVLWMGVMYCMSGLPMFWWVFYVTQYDFMSWSWVWVLFLPQLAMLRSYYRTIEVISWVGLVFSLISLFKFTNNGYMQFLCEGFTLGAGLVVLTQRYHERRLNVLCYVVLVLGFLTATIHARRNLMLTSGCYMAAAACQLMFGTLIKSSTTRLMLIMTCIFTLLCCTGFYMVNDRGMFGKITNRFSDNTREYVYLHYAADFGTHQADLITGRSMMGTYECGGVEGEEGNGGQRSVVESGYLNNILKGGFIFLALYLTLMIRAVRRGLKCHNALGKACAWILIFQLIDMFYFGIHSFNLKAYMLWMLVAVALNRDLMSKTDAEIQHMLYQPKPELPKWKRRL